MAIYEGAGKIGTGDQGRITLEDVKNKFKEYNFIIRTQGLTIDTTNYYGCGWIQNFTGVTTVPEQIGLDMANDKVLILYKRRKPYSGTDEFNQQDGLVDVVMIPDTNNSSAIKNDFKITVKSNRDFLENQETTTYH